MNRVPCMEIPANQFNISWHGICISCGNWYKISASKWCTPGTVKMPRKAEENGIIFRFYAWGLPVKAPYRWILRNSCDLLFMLIYTDTHFACTLIVYIICICTCTLTGARHCIEPICSMGLEYLPTNLLASGEYTIYGTHLPTKTARLPFTQVHFTCSSGYWGRPVALCHDGGNLGRKFAPLSFHILQS